MVAYGFKEQFIEPTWSGRKVHTIRNKRTGRSRHAKPGEKLQHYVGMRTKQCRKFAESICLDVRPIRLTFSRRPSEDFVDIAGMSIICGPQSLDRFAQSDGFKDWAQMRQFWKVNHGHSAFFDGDIIYWKDMEPIR